jgi:hypothetical protein
MDVQRGIGKARVFQKQQLAAFYKSGAFFLSLFGTFQNLFKRITVYAFSVLVQIGIKIFEEVRRRTI